MEKEGEKPKMYTKPNNGDNQINSKDAMQQPVPVIQGQQYYVVQPQ